MTRYEKFGTYLDSQEESFSITFKKIEEIIEEKLPPLAYEHQAWWSNNDSHPLMNLILAKNWKSKNLNLDEQKIEFYKITEAETFYFVEKDFESTIKEKVPRQYLFDRFKILYKVLKNNLSNSFNEAESKVALWAPHGVVMKHQFLWFVRKNTFIEKPKDSIQFQLTIDTKPQGELSIGIWLDGEANKTRIHSLQKILENKKQFRDIIEQIPPSYYIGVKVDKNYSEIKLAQIDDKFIDIIIKELSKKKTEFYVRRYVTKKEAINYESKIISEISNTFDELVPISEFLGIWNKLNLIVNNNTTKDMVDENIQEIIDILEWKKNVILYGPPGTGKTYVANEVAKVFIPQNSENNPLTKSQENRRHTWKTLTTLVLIENKGKPLNYHEIADRILEKNIIETRGKTPHETLAKIMRDDIKENEDESYFRNPSTGMYELNIPMTFKKAAETILFANNKPMHYNDINNIAIENQFVNTEGESPEKTLGAVITKDIATNGDDSIFVSNGSGKFSLRRKNPVSSEIIESSDNNRIRMVTFHPSYSYEDFIEGIRPNTIDNHVIYVRKDGIFKDICENAQNNKNKKYLLIIDEINRGNISKIFGELITLIEENKRGKIFTTLAYSQKEFTVPENLHIIGTMNTADKSLIEIDTALRRRFAFIELTPKPDLKEMNRKVGNIHLGTLLGALNQRIREEDLRDKQIGHSYFMNISENDQENHKELQRVFKYEIIPLLHDYFYGDFELLEKVLGGKIISKNKLTINYDLINNWDNFEGELLKIIKRQQEPEKEIDQEPESKIPETSED